MDAVLTKTEGSGLPRGGWGLFAILVLSLGILFLQAHRVAAIKVVGLPVIVGDPATLDVGERWEGEKYSWPIPICNRSDRAVSIESFRTSCTCISVEPSRVQLAAHATATLKATIQGTPNRRQAAGVFHLVSLTGEGTDGEPLLVVHLHGRVRPSCEVNPAEVAFNGPVARGALSKPVRVRLKPCRPASAVRVDPDPELSVEVASADPGFELSVRARPREAGVLARSVQVTLEDSDGKTVGTCAIPVKAEVVEPVYANPSEFNFGIVRTGTVAQLSVRLVSANGQTFQVESWTCSDGVRMSALPDGFHYDLSFLVRAGEQTAEINYTVRLPSDEKVKVPVRLRAYGSD